MNKNNNEEKDQCTNADEENDCEFQYEFCDFSKRDASVGAVVAFTANYDCTDYGMVTFIGQLSSQLDISKDSWRKDSLKSHDRVEIVIPSIRRVISVPTRYFGKMFMQSFENDVVIIDIGSMIYPVKNENGNMLHKAYTFTNDERAAVGDIKRKLITTRISNTGTSCQSNINKLLNTLRKKCPDADLISYKIMIVYDYGIYFGYYSGDSPFIIKQIALTE